MLVPPRPWTRWDSGGYIRLKPRVMRTHGSSVQVEALKRARLDRVFEALNALGRVRWRVNAPALGAIEDAWARSLAIADLPSRHDLEVPSSLPSEEMKALRRAAETAREATLAAASELAAARGTAATGDDPSDQLVAAASDAEAASTEASKAYSLEVRRRRLRRRTEAAMVQPCDARCMVIKV